MHSKRVLVIKLKRCSAASSFVVQRHPLESDSSLLPFPLAKAPRRRWVCPRSGAQRATYKYQPRYERGGHCEGEVELWSQSA